MQSAYSGMRWWTWDELKPWIDYLVKKRFNSMGLEMSCGIIPLTAAKLGIGMERTAWQKERAKLMRRVLEYARELGITIAYGITPNCGKGYGVPGFAPYSDGEQLKEFVRLYAEKHNYEIKTIPLNWCGMQNIVLDPTDPVTKEFLTAMVQAYAAELGTDHVYGMWTPTEESWAEEDLEKANAATYAAVMEMIGVIKAGDPEARIWSPRVCVDNPTAEAQARAVRDAGLPVHGNMFLNHAGRMYDFLRTDYYWGLPWTTGMCGQCGRETNPNGDVRAAIENAQQLVNNPKAANCIGFMVSSETNHRNVMTMDLYAELSWDPNDLDPEEYPKRWNARRYGDSAELVEHYFLPRVRLYMQKMRELIETGNDISGRLVDRGSDVDLPSRIADWATPQGNAPWSAYGDTCEPELTAGDEDLAHELICAGSVIGKYDFYEGPLDALVRELLDRYPVPDDLDAIMAEPDHAPIRENREEYGCLPMARILHLDGLEIVKKGLTRARFKFALNLDVHGFVFGHTGATFSGVDDIGAALRLLAKEFGRACQTGKGPFPSDGTPLAALGIPALQFGRGGHASGHTSLDDIRHISPKGLAETGELAELYLRRYVTRAAAFPFPREIDDEQMKAIKEWFKRTKWRIPGEKDKKS